MRRKLHVVRLLWLAAGLTVFSIGTHFLHGYQVQRNAGRLLEQATHAEETGQLHEAAEYLGRYLGLAPDDSAALTRFSLLLAKLAHTPQARLRASFTLEQALRRDPEQREVRRKLVDLAFDLHRYDDAREHLLILMQTAPADAGLLRQMGRCEEARGQYAAAAGWYGRAIRQQPHEVESYDRLARLLRHRLGQPEQGDQKMEDLVAANEGSVQAHLARARYYREVSTEDEAARATALKRAAEAIDRALALAPQDVDVLLEAAEVAQAQGNLAGARTSLQNGMKLGPRNVRVYQALARLEAKAGQRAAAIDCLRRGLQAAPNQGELLWTLAELLIESGETAEAESTLARLDQIAYTPPLVDYLKARVLMRKEQWHAAARAFEAVLPPLTDTPDLAKRVHLFLGECYGHLGDSERQYAAFRQAVAIDPLWVPGCLALGATLASQGRIDEALESYQRITAADPRAKVLMARLMMLRTLRLPPARRQWADVEKLLDEATRHLPDSVEIPLLRAEIQANQDQPDARAKAWQLVAEARDRRPKEPAFWLALADLAPRQGKDPLAVLEEAEHTLGDVVPLRLARARYWAEHGGKEAAPALAQLAGGLVRFPNAERQQLLLALAEAHVQIGARREASRLYQQLAERKPNDLQVRLRMFDLAVELNDDGVLASLIDEVRRIEGEEGALWRYGKAVLLTRRARAGDKSGLGEAETLLAAAATRRPNWARVPLCRGEIAEINGDLDTAVSQYQRAIELGERSPVVVRRAVQLLYERHRYAEADQLLQHLQEHAPQLADLDRLGAEVALHQRAADRAVRLARKAVSADSKDHRALLWLGQVLLLAGQPAEAEPVLRRAVGLADQVPETWVALVQALVRMGHKDRAEAALREAEQKLANHARKALALAACCEALDHKVAAKKHYEAALAAQPDDVAVLRNAALFFRKLGDLETAERHFRTLMAMQTKAPEDAAWARRTLAIGLAATGDYQRSQTAMALLGLTDGPDRPQSGIKESVENRRAQAVVLAAQKNTRHRREAIARLEGMRQRREATSDDQFLLAQLYEGVGEWPKARDTMQHLLTDNGDNVTYLAYFVQGLLRHDDVDEAAIWFARLQQREPETVGTLTLKALLLAAQGKGAEAVPFLQQLAGADAARMRNVALLLERIGQVAAAEKMWRDYVAQSSHPERVLELALFLGRQNRAEEALALCEPAWKTCPPETVADASVTVLYAARVTPAQCQRVAGWLEAAIQKHSERATLLFQLANVRHMQGRYPDAVKLFRQVIERDPRHALALNNLAWLLIFKENKGKEALELIQRAVHVRGDTAEMLDTRGVVYLALGQSEPAIQDLEEANAQAATAPRWFHLARGYQMAGNHAAAIATLRRADKLGLREDRLEPLERATYRRVRTELESRSSGAAKPADLATKSTPVDQSSGALKPAP